MTKGIVILFAAIFTVGCASKGKQESVVAPTVSSDAASLESPYAADESMQVIEEAKPVPAKKVSRAKSKKKRSGHQRK